MKFFAENGLPSANKKSFLPPEDEIRRFGEAVPLRLSSRQPVQIFYC